MTDTLEVPIPDESNSLESTSSRIIQLVEKVKGTPWEDHINWFPVDLKPEKIHQLPDREKAIFTAMVFANIVKWHDVADIVLQGFNRKLEITDREIQSKITFIPQLTQELSNYTDVLVDQELDGNLALVTAETRTAAGVLGVAFKWRKDTNKQIDIQLTLPGNKVIADPIDAILLLHDELARDTPVETASFDPQSEKFLVKFAASS
jgi:hypothetical protein